MSAKNHMEAVYSLLQGNAAVDALVGTNIFPGTIPQKNTYPAIVYSLLGEDRLETKDGPVNNFHRFTLEIYASAEDSDGGYPKVQSIAKATKNLLEWYSGELSGFTYSIRFKDQVDAPYEEAPEAFKIIQDFSMRVN